MSELTREIHCQKCGTYMGIYALLRKRVPCLCAGCNKEGIPIRLNKRQMKKRSLDYPKYFTKFEDNKSYLKALKKR